MQVGMSKGGSKFGRRSNWFKINFLLEEKQKATMKMNNNLSEHMKAVADTSRFSQASALFPTFPTHNQPSPSSTSSSNSLDLTSSLSQYTKLSGNADLSMHSNPFYSAAMQYPLHPALLQTAIDGLSAFYFNQNMLQQQRNESISSNDDTDSDDASTGGQRHHAAAAVTKMRMAASPTPSTSSSATSASSSSSSIAVPSSDNQDYPIDLSIKSSPRQVDFSISNLLKIPTA